LFETGDGFVPDGRLVERGEDSERVDERWDFGRIGAVASKFENALADFHEKLVVVIHLFDYLDQVRDELLFDSIVAFVIRELPRTSPITGIFPAAFSFSEGLSLFSY
jgi:hypothetical protein